MLGLAALAVATLGACTTPPPARSTARVFFVDTQGGARACTVPTSLALAADRVTDAQMTVGNDGGWCGVTVSQPGPRPYAAGLVSTRPQHGRVHVRTVGDVTRVDFYPDAGFVGTDSFTVTLLPGSHRLRVAVTVQPGPAAAAPASAPATQLRR
jgi:hypothetical protein